MRTLEEIFQSIDQAKPAMMETWKSLVDRDCGSGNKAGVDSVGQDIRRFLEPLGFKVRFHEYEKAGNMLVAEYGDMTKPFVILTGHMDTVFADGTAAERPFTVQDGRVTGPGVLDMKGGITVMLYAVKTLLESGWNRYPLKIILAGDEEVGHGWSDAAQDYRKEARGALMAFNYETGFIDNGIVLERKGCAQYRFDFHGVGAHAGNNPEDGRSAVKELCHKALDMEALTDMTEGTTVNVGVIAGGTVPNAIPENAWCRVDVRFRTMAGIKRVEKALQEITDKVYIDQVQTTCRCEVKMGAMERLASSEALFGKANQIAREAGLPEMKAIAVGGGSDSAYITAEGVPALCAMGVKGQFNHTVREWAEESSLTERAKLSAALLMKL
jgi:peptidase dimerisation domain protein